MSKGTVLKVGWQNDFRILERKYTVRNTYYSDGLLISPSFSVDVFKRANCHFIQAEILIGISYEYEVGRDTILKKISKYIPTLS